MAEKKESGGGGDGGILSWFIWIILGLGIAWFATGGPNRQSSREGVFIKPLAPIDTGETYGGKYINPSDKKSKTTLILPDSVINIETIEEKISDFTDKAKELDILHKFPISSRLLIIDGFVGAKIKDSQKEYVRILSNSDLKQTLITGMTLMSSITKNSVTIPSAVKLPILGTISKSEPVYISPRYRAIINTGRSPIGDSFQVNICSGYLGQFQTYSPELRKECPEPVDEMKKYGINDSACRDFVKDIPKCSIYTSPVPENLTNECKKFVTEKLTYNACVAVHKTETDFYREEWRLFLGKTVELWKEKQEIIKLLDTKGNLLDAITY
jgi:hypothetical protein